jgi:hypothetical protein
MHNAFRIAAITIPVLLLAACGFVGSDPISASDPPGFFTGIWHGMLAPWTLVLRLFMDIGMYATPNTGWFYDFGFLIGVVGSIPGGWLAVIIAIFVHIF